MDSFDGFNEFVVRFCLAAPLLYIGVTMMLDPGGLVAFAANFASALRAFEQRFRGEPWYQQAPEPESLSTPAVAIRLFGWMLAALAVVHLAGLTG